MKLHKRAKRYKIENPHVLRVTLNPSLHGDRSEHLLCVPSFGELSNKTPTGFGAMLIFSDDIDSDPSGEFAAGLESLSYLSEGDVVALNPDGLVRVLFRRSSAHNFIFATNNCNSL